MPRLEIFPRKKILPFTLLAKLSAIKIDQLQEEWINMVQLLLLLLLL